MRATESSKRTSDTEGRSNWKSSMALSSDPRRIGHILCSTKERRVTWTQEELAEHLYKLKYKCLGQLHDLLEKELDLNYQLGLEKAKNDRNSS